VEPAGRRRRKSEEEEEENPLYQKSKSKNKDSFALSLAFPLAFFLSPSIPFLRTHDAPQLESKKKIKKKENRVLKKKFKEFHCSRSRSSLLPSFPLPRPSLFTRS
jgi:hypothetical protein